MRSYLWWWATLLAILVFVGWATGSAHTGATVARYFGFSVVGIMLALLVVSGFVELRQRSQGVVGDEALAPPPRPTLRQFVATWLLLAICALLAIDEAGSDWLAFAVALIGVFLFGGRLVAMLLRSRTRSRASGQAS
jgi:hypothetical protein